MHNGFDSLNGINICSGLAIEQVEVTNPYGFMLGLQQALQERLGMTFDPNQDPKKLAERIIYWRHCLQDELSEIHDWAPFDTPEKTKEAKFEVIDALHFANNILLELGVTGAELEESIDQPKLYGGETHASLEAEVGVALKNLFLNLPWKSWKTYDEAAIQKLMARNRLVASASCVVSTLMQYALWFGMSPNDVAMYYAAKSKENHARQDRGY